MAMNFNQLEKYPASQQLTTLNYQIQQACHDAYPTFYIGM